MESERERLERMYGELGDEHLLNLLDDRDSLTDDARFVLDNELRRRNLLPQLHRDVEAPPTVEPEHEQGFTPGFPGIIPDSAGIMEHALDDENGQVYAGMVRLIAFYDGIELSRACTALEDADIDFAIEEIAGDALNGAPPHYQLWVEQGGVDLAIVTLRRERGLFPEPEVDSTGDTSDEPTADPDAAT